MNHPSKTKSSLNIGLAAHVDAGKTTLSEAILYLTGCRKQLGRVDHGDTFLDTHQLERDRGITIFTKEARFFLGKIQVTLLDTPGHVDFSTETERTLSVLDCAVLVISGTDGPQAHTLTLWQLLRRYEVPTFFFVNKMDLPGLGKEKLMDLLRRQFGDGCVDFSGPLEDQWENLAVLDEGLMERYLEEGQLSADDLSGLVGQRKLFPVYFGAALKLEGVEALLHGLEIYGPRRSFGPEFGARVYKIARDQQGNRMTCLKVTGGVLKARDVLRYAPAEGEPLEEKITQIRLYDGPKFQSVQQVDAGACCAVLGLSRTYAGQGLGAAEAAGQAVLEPVMSYCIRLPQGSDPRVVLPKLKQLEEEDPQLHIEWDQRRQQIQARLMGKVQIEILQSLIRQRFDLVVTVDTGRITYKETIENTVEGVGHYEPLRHYAEVHLLLEPLPRGSGLVFDTKCSTDSLDLNWQRLILTHLAEKSHLGVLTGSAITDVKITLMSGKAHLKHTEGGDFRQATYRAVRQGLMQANSVLLEPWYRFRLEVPTEQIGRAITDIRAMSGEFEAPETVGELSILEGLAPVSEMREYAGDVAAYTRGRGRLSCALDGYAPCPNTPAVLAGEGYDPERDLENPADSVFCAHGAGFNVPWRQVPEYMHLESCLKPKKEPAPQRPRTTNIDDRELEAIMEREFGPIRRPQYGVSAKSHGQPEITVATPKDNCLIVDGYNVIFAWPELAQLAREDLAAARSRLMDLLSNFAGFKKCYLVLVFDGYKVKGNRGERTRYHNIQVVYTKENESGDMYIEALVNEIGRNYNVRVASSDGLIQLSSFRSGVLRMSSQELREEVEAAQGQIAKTLKELEFKAQRTMSKRFDPERAKNS